MPLYKKYNTNPHINKSKNRANPHIKFKENYANPHITIKFLQQQCHKPFSLIFQLKLNRYFHPTLELHPEILLVNYNYHIHKPKPEVFGEFTE